MQGVKEGLNRMLNLIREEADEVVATAWRDLEVDRDRLQNLHTKAVTDLQLCQRQLASQSEMLKTAKEESASLQKELVLSANAQR